MHPLVMYVITCIKRSLLLDPKTLNDCIFTSIKQSPVFNGKSFLTTLNYKVMVVSMFYHMMYLDKLWRTKQLAQQPTWWLKNIPSTQHSGHSSWFGTPASVGTVTRFHVPRISGTLDSRTDSTWSLFQIYMWLVPSITTICLQSSEEKIEFLSEKKYLIIISIMCHNSLKFTKTQV